MEPSGDFFDRIVCARATSQNLGGNAFSEDNWMAETAARVERNLSVFSTRPPSARHLSAIKLDVLKKRADDFVEYTLHVAHVPKHYFLIFLAQLQKNRVAISGESICAKWVRVTDPIARLIVHLSQSLPCDTGINECVNGSYLEQIKKSKRYRMINWVELAVPNGRRTMAPVFHSEFIAFQPTTNSLRRDGGQP